MSKTLITSRGLTKALIDVGLVHHCTKTAEVVSANGVLMIKSERYIPEDEAPKLAEAFAALTSGAAHNSNLEDETK